MLWKSTISLGLIDQSRDHQLSNTSSTFPSLNAFWRNFWANSPLGTFCDFLWTFQTLYWIVLIRPSNIYKDRIYALKLILNLIIKSWNRIKGSYLRKFYGKKSVLMKCSWIMFDNFSSLLSQNRYKLWKLLQIVVFLWVIESGPRKMENKHCLDIFSLGSE